MPGLPFLMFKYKFVECESPGRQFFYMTKNILPFLLLFFLPLVTIKGKKIICSPLPT
jgi:hypothetical protein